MNKNLNKEFEKNETFRRIGRMEKLLLIPYEVIQGQELYF